MATLYNNAWTIFAHNAIFSVSMLIYISFQHLFLHEFNELVRIFNSISGRFVQFSCFVFHSFKINFFFFEYISMKCFTFYRCPSLIWWLIIIWFLGACCRKHFFLFLFWSMSAQRSSLSGSERHLYLTVLEISNQNINLMLLQVRCSITPLSDCNAVHNNTYWWDFWWWHVKFLIIFTLTH